MANHRITDPHMKSVRHVVGAMIGVVIGFGVLTAMTQYRETRSAHHSAFILDNAMPSVEELSAARGDLAQLRTCVARLIRYNECDPSTIAANRRTLGAVLDKYNVLPHFPMEVLLGVAVRDRLASLDERIGNIEDLAKRGVDEPTSMALARALIDHAMALDDSLQTLIVFHTAEAATQGAVLESSREQSMAWTIGIDVLAMALAAWTVTVIWGVLKRSIALREEVSRAHETDFRLLVDSVRDYGIFLLDADGNVTSWNAGAEQIIGYRAEEIVHRHFSVFYPPGDRARCPTVLEAAHQAGGFQEEGWLMRKDQSLFWADSILTPLRNPDGTLKGFIKAVRDRTLFKRAEEDHRQHDVAQAANRAKDEFLAILGHELRNPLAPIATAVEIMKLRDAQASSHELEIIGRQVALLIRLVDDLLDVSRITIGKILIHKRSLDLDAVVARALETASPMIAQRHLRCDLQIAAGLRVDADEERLVQIVTNLMTNAAKYSDPGGCIIVHAWRDATAVIIEVKDDGIGIAPALLPHVFDLFVQGLQGSDRAGGGLGLGLSIVHRLVDAHGGTVEARSEGLGKGSTFVVHLPLAESPALELPPPTEPQPAAVAVHRVLLVDDNLDALHMMRQLLQMMGHEVRTAPDGPAALELVDTFRPDIAILDIGLPGMSGYELAAELRAKLGDKTPKLVALTGYGQESDRAKSRAAGFEIHLAKPVDRKRLLETLETAA